LAESEDGEMESNCQNLQREEEELVGKVTEVTSGEQNKLSTGSLQQYHLLLMSECAASTAMELSSEDMRSECDG
jgi:hypothetical protein